MQTTLFQPGEACRERTVTIIPGKPMLTTLLYDPVAINMIGQQMIARSRLLSIC